MEIEFGPEDVANTRFAFSPIWESVASFWALHDPSRHALHLPWIRRAQPAFGDLATPLLNTLLLHRSSYPDFLTPAPDTPLPDLDAELDTLARTPADVVRSDLAEAFHDFDPNDPGALAPFVEKPERSAAAIADELRAYFDALLADPWPRMRALLEADVTHRARTLALEGPDALFGGLSPRLAYRDGTLKLLKFSTSKGASCFVGTVPPKLEGRGMLLIPSVFTKAYTVAIGAHHRETIQYRARGVHQLWYPELPRAAAGLEHLLGTPRARLLKQLAAPATPSELAHRLQVTPSAVSQQLGWLRDAGLVLAIRRGRTRSYELSHIGHALLAAYDDLTAFSDDAVDPDHARLAS